MTDSRDIQGIGMLTHTCIHREREGERDIVGMTHVLLMKSGLT